LGGRDVDLVFEESGLPQAWAFEVLAPAGIMGVGEAIRGWSHLPDIFVKEIGNVFALEYRDP
jgi:hypothetical protein